MTKHGIGYLATMGEVPESGWLTGSVIGFRGPWGTTYPANLRLSVVNMTEDQWVETLRTRKGLPPMPWIDLVPKNLPTETVAGRWSVA